MHLSMLRGNAKRNNSARESNVDNILVSPRGFRKRYASVNNRKPFSDIQNISISSRQIKQLPRNKQKVSQSKHSIAPLTVSNNEPHYNPPSRQHPTPNYTDVPSTKPLDASDADQQVSAY